MIGPEQPQRGRLPRQVRQGLIALYGQVFICAVTLFSLISNINTRNEHGQEVLPVVHVLVFTSIVLGLAVLACAVAIRNRQRWGRPVALGVEVLVLLVGGYSLFSSVELGLVSIVYAVLVLVQVGRFEADTWSMGDQPPTDHVTG
jgi:uncharacterized membrane protein YhaH (DUF805 family)